MDSSTFLLDRIGPQFLRSRNWVYSALSGLVLGLLISTGSVALVAMLVFLVAAATLPSLSRPTSRVFCALIADTSVAVISWWLFGPAAGTDFALLILAAVAGMVYDGWRRVALVAVVVAAAAVQIPLHFLAKASGLPMFHEPAQVISDGEFVIGVVVRLVVLSLAFALFTLVGRGLRLSRKALATSEATFRGAFEESPIGVALVAPDASVLRSNRQVSNLGESGITIDEGFDITRLFDKESRDRIRSGIIDVTSVEGTALDFEVRSSGEPQLDLRVAMASVDLDSNQTGAIVTIEDVTERVEDHRRLEGLIKSKDEFVASVSHELRTPLTAVIGFAGILGETWRDLGEEDLDSLIRVILRESSEVASIVEDLLVIARADIGRVTLLPDELDLASEVDAVVNALDPEVCNCVSVVHDDEVPTVWGDPVRFRQIVRNLLSNAVRYGGPTVTIESSRVGEMVEVAIVDNGTGIKGGDEARIFEPYVRAHERPTQPSSVGLGLAVARSLSRAMGGDLIYVREGGLTRFVLRLPAVRVGATVG